MESNHVQKLVNPDPELDDAFASESRFPFWGRICGPLPFNRGVDQLGISYTLNAHRALFTDESVPHGGSSLSVGLMAFGEHAEQ